MPMIWVASHFCKARGFVSLCNSFTYKGLPLPREARAEGPASEYGALNTRKVRTFPDTGLLMTCILLLGGWGNIL